MNKLIFLLILSAISISMNAQQVFVSKGKIEFEKQVSISNQYEEENPSNTGRSDIFTDALRKALPKVQSTYFDLIFDENRSLYKPGREVIVAQKVPDWISGPATDNIIFNDFSKEKTISQKSIYDDILLLEDSMRRIDWKITNDTRTIAGFDCRKAVGKIMDSVYVIAFYTDQVILSGGPESFNGLPGMIMGLAIPRLHTTWYATKLELIQPKETDLTAPKKGRKATIEDMKKQLKRRDFGESKRNARNLWQVMI